MTRTVYRTVGSRRYSPRPKKSLIVSLGASFDAMLGKLNSASTRLKAARRKSR